MKDRGRFLRVGEVARRFGVTGETVRAWANSGVLRAIRIRTQRYFRESDVARLFDQKRSA